MGTGHIVACVLMTVKRKLEKMSIQIYLDALSPGERARSDDTYMYRTSLAGLKLRAKDKVDNVRLFLLCHQHNRLAGHALRSPYVGGIFTIVFTITTTTINTTRSLRHLPRIPRPWPISHRPVRRRIAGLERIQSCGGRPARPRCVSGHERVSGRRGPFGKMRPRRCRAWRSLVPKQQHQREPFTSVPRR